MPSSFLATFVLAFRTRLASSVISSQQKALAAAVQVPRLKVISYKLINAVLRSRKLILIIFLTSTGLLTAVMVFWEMRGTIWTPWDHHTLELLQRAVVENQANLLDQQFARVWSSKEVFGVLVLISIILTSAAMLKRAWALHVAGAMLAGSLVVVAWLEFMRFSLFPIVCLGGSFLFMFCGLFAGMRVAITKEQRFIRNLFVKRTSERAVLELLATRECLQHEGEERTLTVMFTDVVGFTALTEQVPLRMLKGLLNDFFTEMTDLVIAEGGLVDKFMGDMLMAEFGALQPAPDHAERAVCAALKMQRRLLDLRQQWARQGWPSLQCRFGINTGAVLLGNMGAREIVDYTVLGETVNFAARLERLNKTYGTSLLISESTHAQLSPQLFRTRLLDRVKTHSSAMAINLYEVYGDLATFRSLRNTAYYQTYHEAFTAYLAQDFAGARTKFFQTLAFYPDDPATKILLERIATLLANGIPENWDGAATLGSL